eukprot:6200591-Pleurochrysis_carterae.AAC.1
MGSGSMPLNLPTGFALCLIVQRRARRHALDAVDGSCERTAQHSAQVDMRVRVNETARTNEVASDIRTLPNPAGISACNSACKAAPCMPV